MIPTRTAYCISTSPTLIIMALIAKSFHPTTGIQYLIYWKRYLLRIVIWLCICILVVLVSAPLATTKNDRIKNQTISAPLVTTKNDRIQNQIQVSHTTAMNRYPDEYTAVKEYVEDHMSSTPNMKFLSFGSSTGLEAISLASLYFNDTKHSNITIYGVDIDQTTLNEAKQNVAKQNPPILESKISFFNGKDTDINAYGKYDVIFANSVLCFHGSRDASAKNIMAHFSFDDFEATLTNLDTSLREGGLFAMVNSNYFFEDSTVGKRYKRVANCTTNFVPKLDRVTKILVQNPDNKAVDCVWMKESSK